MISCVQYTGKPEDMGASDNQTEIRISPEDRVDIELKAIEVGRGSGSAFSLKLLSSERNFNAYPIGSIPSCCFMTHFVAACWV